MKTLHHYEVSENKQSANTFCLFIIGCANKDLWALCAPIFIIVVYFRTATRFRWGWGGVWGKAPARFSDAAAASSWEGCAI